MSLSKSFATISFFTLLSRISGFARDMMVARYMGAGAIMDAWGVAFKMPNFFRRLFAEGAFTAAFVPITSGIVATDGKEKARDFSEKAMSFMACFLLIFTLLIEITMPFVMYGMAPGFHNNPEKFEMTIYLTRLTFPYLLFISLASLCAGLLNSIGRFAAGSATSIILNLTLMAALWVFASKAETPAHALSYGVAIAGVLQFLWLLIICKKMGVGLRFRRPRLTPEIKNLLKKMLPGFIAAGIVQINLWVDTIIASFFEKAVSYLYFADRLHQFPLSLIGTAMGTALLPMLARKIKENDKNEVYNTQNRALEMVLFLSLPAAVALIIIPYPIVSVLFEGGKFGADESLAVAYAIMAFAIGLPAFVMTKIFSTIFFAEGDTKTPVRVAVICMALNIILNLVFIKLFPMIGIMPHVGLATATSLASWVNIIILFYILYNKKKIYLDRKFIDSFKGILTATGILVLLLLFSNNFLQLNNVITLAAIICLSGITYIAVAYKLKAIRKEDITRLLRRNKVS